MFVGSMLILDAWGQKPGEPACPQGFKLFIIYGELGIGKSAYAFKVGVETLMQIYGFSQKQAWDAIKQLLIFTPEQFLTKLAQIRERIPFLIWDDAGVWLPAMKWQDPLLEQVIKMLNVLRSKLAALLLTTPSPEMILKRVRAFPGAIEVCIILNTRKGHLWDRKAKGYAKIRVPDGRYFPRLIYKDSFSCLLPKEFYKWYEPVRRSYQELAEELLEEEWEKAKQKSRVLRKLAQYRNLSQLPSLSNHPFM